MNYFFIRGIEKSTWPRSDWFAQVSWQNSKGVLLSHLGDDGEIKKSSYLKEKKIQKWHDKREREERIKEIPAQTKED